MISGPRKATAKPNRSQIRAQRSRSNRGIMRHERRDGRRVRFLPTFAADRIKDSRPTL